MMLDHLKEVLWKTHIHTQTILSVKRYAMNKNRYKILFSPFLKLNKRTESVTKQQQKSNSHVRKQNWSDIAAKVF
jgi:hypothetical protein